MPPVDALRAQARPEPCAERIDPFRGAAEDLQTRGGAAVLRVGTAQQDRQSTEFPIQQEQPVVDDATAFVRAPARVREAATWSFPREPRRPAGDDTGWPCSTRLVSPHPRRCDPSPSPRRRA